MAEPFHLHLLELAGAEDEVSRRHFVAEALADLGDAEGHFDAGGVDDVLKVQEDALRGFGAKIGFDSSLWSAPTYVEEHQIEISRFGQRSRRR